MKKIHIASLFASIGIGGGVEYVQSTLSKGLVQKGYAFTHLVMEDKRPHNEYAGGLYVFNKKFIPGFGIKKILSLFTLARKVKRVCKELCIDCILGQGDFFYMVTGLSKLLGNRATCIAVVHTTITIWPPFIKKVLLFFINRHDHIVVISEQEKNTYLTRYQIPENKVSLIYNFLDTETIQKKLQQRLPQHYTSLFEKKCFTFITIGRLTYQKGHDILIKAFDIVRHRHPATQLIIIGEGENRDELTTSLQFLDSGKQIFFIGNQNNVFPFLNHADCFVLSSRFEGFPIVLLEAAYVEMPIISSDCPTGPSELLPPERLYNYKDETGEELARRMEAMISFCKNNNTYPSLTISSRFTYETLIDKRDRLFKKTVLN